MSRAIAAAVDVAVDARSLARRSRADLDRLFRALPPPAIGELAGLLRGTVVELIGLGRLPPGLRAAILAALRGPLGLWRGKRFAGSQGTNVWGMGRVERLFAAFRVETAPALDGSGSCVRLDYDVAENPLPVRAILGELRGLGPGLFLGRMHYRAGSATACVLYFTLEA
jgi:hypothetical protein